MNGDTDTTPTKVAVLGGGAASLVTAFELTRPELSGKYDVTVYQMGWRLGGKGASGRNSSANDRIEEHGLHIWMGFYDNAFRVMQEAYAEMGRTTGPLQTWKDAFKEHGYVAFMEPFAGKTERWDLVFPKNDLVPGPGEEPTLWEMTAAILRFMHEHWSRSPHAQAAAASDGPEIPLEILDRVRAATLSGAVPRPTRVSGWLAQIETWALPRAELAVHPVGRLLAHAHAIASTIPHDAVPSDLETRCLVWLIRAAMDSLWLLVGNDVATNFLAFQLWVGVNLAGAAASGILSDRILDRGWSVVDDVDFREWLAKYRATQPSLDSAPLRVIYDLVFGFVGGDVKKGRFAAGTAMRGLLRMLFAYKGSIFYKMQAGMGDTVFTPLYLVLKQRGVKFRFFHRVENLKVDPETKLVTALELTEQVALLGEDYDPLVDVDGLPCWPSEPLYAQIRSGDELEASGIHLESAWSANPKEARPKRLERGRDFDLVVLGISIGAFPFVAKELSAESPAFAAMVENVKTAQTSAFQLWLEPDLAGLGWKNPFITSEAPIVGGIVEPLDTWADMSHLLARETWPKGASPGSVAYFCGPFDEPAPLPPFSDHAFPVRELVRFDALAKNFLREGVSALWPNATLPNDFRWDALVDGSGSSGEARFRAQYRRVNLDPSERYVLSVPGSGRYRLPADGAQIPNVFLAGDWTQCGLDAGCVEAAVTSGLLAARAISGGGRPVAWENSP